MSCDGVSVIREPLLSDDSRWGLSAAQALGCAVENSGSYVQIEGIGRRRPKPSGQVHVGAAGTVARFLPCILAAGEVGHWTLTADEQMMLRPVDGLIDSLRKAGAKIQSLSPHGGYPLAVFGNSLACDEIDVSGVVSSQYLSGILISAPLLEKTVTIVTDGNIVQSDYVNITIDCMRQFGADVEPSDDLRSITVRPSRYQARDFTVEADASTATYFAALPALLGGSIRISNLRPDTIQPDIQFLTYLDRLGCNVKLGPFGGATIQRPDGLERLKGGWDFDLSACSDCALTLAALSAFADEPVTIRGISHIRHHECDRISAMTTALSASGINVIEHDDGWTIHPGRPRYATLETRNDHRLAMALTLVGLAGNGARLNYPGCVRKTCPDYFKMIESFGVPVSFR